MHGAGHGDAAVPMGIEWGWRRDGEGMERDWNEDREGMEKV